MSLFDGKPLTDDETPDINGKFRRPEKPRVEVRETTLEAGDSMCKHHWMWRGKSNKFCIYCHRKIRMERP